MMPTVVKNLLIINGLMFLGRLLLEPQIPLVEYLGLHMIGSGSFMPHQIITHMFMHGDFAHLFSNMFALWMFGTAIENVLGPKRFLTYYLLTGLGAAILHYVTVYLSMAPLLSDLSTFMDNPDYGTLQMIVNNHMQEIRSAASRSGEMVDMFNKTFSPALQTLNNNPENREALNEVSRFISEFKDHYLSLPNMIGASGAVFGILLAFGMMFPNVTVFLGFLFPIKAKYFVIGYGLLELYLGFQQNPNDPVAHFAHLGGMLVGFILLKFWRGLGR